MSSTSSTHRLLVLLAAVGTACTDPPPPSESDVDATWEPGPDGGGIGGLELRFVADPEPPASLGGDYRCGLDRVDIELADLRVVGDVPSNPDTTRASMQLRWDDEEEGGDRIVRFDAAPPGRYSYVLVRIASFELRGSLKVDGAEDYRIEDESPVALDLSIPIPEVIVEPGVTATIDIDVRLADVVLDVPWDIADEGDDDEIRIDEDSDLIDGVRAALGHAFFGRASATE